jgi:hypothetical protein
MVLRVPPSELIVHYSRSGLAKVQRLQAGIPVCRRTRSSGWLDIGCQLVPCKSRATETRMMLGVMGQLQSTCVTGLCCENRCRFLNDQDFDTSLCSDARGHVRYAVVTAWNQRCISPHRHQHASETRGVSKNFSSSKSYISATMRAPALLALHSIAASEQACSLPPNVRFDGTLTYIFAG